MGAPGEQAIGAVALQLVRIKRVAFGLGGLRGGEVLALRGCERK